MKKLTKLTKKQLDSLPHIAKEWINLITSGTTDDAAARVAVKRIYERGKLPPPKVTIILDDPIQCLWGRFFAAIYLRIVEGKMPQVRAQVYDQVGAQIRDQVDNQVAQIDEQIDDTVDDQIGYQIDYQVDYQIRDQIGDQIRDKINVQIRDQILVQIGEKIDVQVGHKIDDRLLAQVRDQIRDRKNLWQYPSFSIWWSAWRKWREVVFDFLGEEYLGDGWMQLDRARVSWSWFYPNIAILCRMPVLYRNASGALHREDGAAIVYPSGLSYYFYNGVRVNEKIIMRPEELTIEDVKNERNEEVRRVIIERMGERFAQASQLEIISTDKFGKLVKCQYGNISVVYAYVRCPSTDREYFLRVPETLEQSLNMLRVNKGITWEEWDEQQERTIWPPSGKMETCRQAVAWTFGVEAKDFTPIYET